MRKLRNRLPPVGALVAFEAAARHLSFTLAAGELGVSQAAVSRQIRMLEDHLGVSLFRRLHRAVRLTAEGQRLHGAVVMGLGHIADATEALRRTRSRSEVAICTTIAFSAFWLMPRIDSFREARPDVELKLIAAEHIVDLAAENIDLGVRYGNGGWTDVTVLRLFDDEVFPVCSPGYLAQHPGMREPADLLHETLLDQEVVDPSWQSWRPWLQRLGVDVPAKLKGPTFNNFNIMMQAAQSGQGIALGWRHLVDHLIAANTLVRPIDASLRTQDAYYLVLPKNVGTPPEALAFRDWILEQAQRHGCAPKDVPAFG